MMGMFIIIYLLLLSNVLNAKPVEQEKESNSFYDAIVKKCSNLQLNDPLYKNQEIFKTCKSWTEISNTKELTLATAMNVRCLLYYHSFVSYCTQVKTTPELNTLVPDVKDLQVSKICNSSVFRDTKIFENVVKLIDPQVGCSSLCSVGFKNIAEPECGLAYHFAVYNTSVSQDATPVEKPKTNPSEILPQSKVEVVNVANFPVVKNITRPSLQDGVKDSEVGQPQHVPEKPESKSVKKEETSNVNKIETREKSIVVPVVKNTSPQIVEAKDNTQAVVDGETQPKPAVNPQNTNDKAATVKSSKDIPAPVKSSQDAPAPVKSSQDAPATNLEKEQSEMESDKTESDLIQKDLTVDQQNAIDQPEQVPDDNLNMENDGGGENYKYGEEEEEEKAAALEVKKDEEEKAAAALEVRKEKPSTLTQAGEMPANYNTTEDLDGESSFFSYFMVVCVLFVLGYVGYHNRQKVLALMLEGKRGKRQVRCRRPNSANYHKLDSNLEEAISSTCTKNSSHVIY